MRKPLAIASLLMLLTACSSFEFPGVYRLKVDQGNIITQEMVDQLELGMSRSQVEYVMGTPLIRDTFSPDRWDYLYVVNKGSEREERHELTAFFENDRLVKIVTDVQPSEKAKIAAEGEDSATQEQ
jgi:outer membrane protein assembly factor BamE